MIVNLLSFLYFGFIQQSVKDKDKNINKVLINKINNIINIKIFFIFQLA